MKIQQIPIIFTLKIKDFLFILSYNIMLIHHLQTKNSEKETVESKDIHATNDFSNSII